MPFKRLDQARPFVTLAIVVIGWLLVPTAVKTFLRASFFELTAPISLATSKVRDLQEFWSLRLHSKNQLIEAGVDLARINSSYELAVQRNSELQSEISRLESLLRLPSFTEYRYEHARVARRDFSGWWQRIVIRKGKNFGIPLDAPVVFTGGVVGKVTEVRAMTAVVELISSPNIRLAGVVEGDTRPITFQGGVNPTFAPPTGVVEFVPLDIVATPGTPKRLVTSGFGGVFPPGLMLGTITRASMGSDGLFQSGEVKLDERLGSLTEVTVLVPLGEK
ncbi:rod shape-determining protein MreC [Horticoccus sp. 23ND18S-11]|uniref:rod shape-determining protein MreC n=1 Tax=Horticoccus sp. 23ND18S-11 TaxID=3391832 RepID=UPI0039C96309